MESNPMAEGSSNTTDWRVLVKPYTEAQAPMAIFQLVTTLGAYLATLALMGWSLQFHYGYTLLLALPAGGFAVRLFILFHDCCHLSFFSSTRANEIVGCLLSPLVFTSYHHWRLEHNHHHAKRHSQRNRTTTRLRHLWL
jgi:omega-6 fatty acid desaturase (delta-12 desaturase)